MNMKPTRRLFLQNASLTVIATSLLPAALSQKHLNEEEDTFSQENLAALDGVSMQTFAAWIGSSFHVTLNRKPLGSLVLLSVQDFGQDGSKNESKEAEHARDASDRPAAVRWIGPQPQPLDESPVTSFALHFKGAGAALPQDTYLLSHDWLGTFPLFLVPSGLSTRRPTCSAVLSLLNDTGEKKSE
jgi:hypothetical protein